MIPDLGRVVEDSAVGFEDDLFQCCILELCARYEVVEVGYVGLVVFAIVIVNGLG